MKLDLALLAIVCLLNLGLGGLVIARYRHKLYARYFLLMSAAISAWAVTNYLTNVHLTYLQSTIVNRAAFATSLIALLAAALLTYEFPLKRKIGGGEKWLLATAFTVPALLSLTPLVAGDVIYYANAKPGFTTGGLAFIYGLGFIYLLASAIRNLVSGVKNENVAIQRQSAFILFGACVTGFIAFSLTFVIPLFVVEGQTNRLIWVLAAVMVGSVAYTIIRHGLFDIRSVIARALGSALAMTLLAVVSVAAMFAITARLYDLKLPTESLFFFAAVTVFVGATFRPLKAVFDRAIARIFYKDAYQAQDLFDQLSKLLGSSLNINYLMRGSADIIANYIRPDYCLISLNTGDHSQRSFGKTNQSLGKDDMKRIRQLSPKIHRNVIVADYIESEYHDLKNVMKHNNIAVLIRLSHNVRRNEEGLGYIVLGPKKSGNTYNAEDMQALEDVANDLVVAIQNALHYEEIQKLNLALQAKIDAATTKLRRSNEKLKELDEAKDDFVSMASHQLRTPLTSIKGYTSMVLEGDAGKINESQRKLLEQTFISSQRMVYLIADLLNVSRLKTGKFIIEPTPVNLAEVVEQEIDQLKETATGRQLTLTYNQPESFPTLMLDESKTRQVIMNFIDNAIYYTPAGGSIKVELTEKPSSVELRVIDSGIGVPRSDRQHLFTKFYRAGNARTARPDGTGLGLFMAKKVIVAQGGAIIFDTHEGKGSTFGFVFSKSKLAPSIDKTKAK